MLVFVATNAKVITKTVVIEVVKVVDFWSRPLDIHCFAHVSLICAGYLRGEWPRWILVSPIGWLELFLEPVLLGSS